MQAHNCVLDYAIMQEKERKGTKRNQNIGCRKLLNREMTWLLNGYRITGSNAIYTDNVEFAVKIGQKNCCCGCIGKLLLLISLQI